MINQSLTMVYHKRGERLSRENSREMPLKKLLFFQNQWGQLVELLVMFSRKS